MKKILGFTIIETTITIIIVSLLIGVIFQIYITIGYIALFVQGQKTIHNELIYLTQSIQNLVDDQGIVLVEYDPGTVGSTSGIDTVLRLADQDYVETRATLTTDDDIGFKYEFSKVCDQNNGTPLDSSDDFECYIEYLKTDAGDIPLPGDTTITTSMTSPDFSEVNTFYVKVIPHESEVDFATTFHDGFGLYLDIQVPNYSDEDRWNRVRYQTQNFFTIRKY